MFESRVKSTFRILDFDVECRPLSWYAGDFVTKEITAIAAAFVDEPREVWYSLLGEQSPEQMLKGFLELYNEAGMVTGHYIRGYDLPIVNGSLLEYGFEPLEAKLSHDTKLDMIKRQGMSNSQENIAAMLELEADKIGMTQEDWRSANRLTPEGLEKTKKRVVGDVIQHIEMRQAMLDRGMLGKPKLWSPNGSGTSKYSA